MNDINVFLTTRIKNIGFLSAVGNLFLAPARFFFSGKTVVIAREGDSNLPKLHGNISKVSSFNSGTVAQKQSKQNPDLTSTAWGYDADAILIPLFQLAVIIPFTIIGTFFKAISLLASRTAREAHKTVKEKLTTKDRTLGTELEPISNDAMLEEKLKAYLKTGQKTNALIIYAQEKTLSEACLKLIRDINPLKLILMGDWKKGEFEFEKIIFSRNNPKKLQNWDVSALLPALKPKNEFDYSVPKSKVVASKEEALYWTSGFFSPKHSIFIVNNPPAFVEPAITEPAGSNEASLN